VVGDLALAGAPLRARFRGSRSRGIANNRLLRALFADASAWRFAGQPAFAEGFSASHADLRSDDRLTCPGRCGVLAGSARGIKARDIMAAEMFRRVSQLLVALLAAAAASTRTGADPSLAPNRRRAQPTIARGAMPPACGTRQPLPARRRSVRRGGREHPYSTWAATRLMAATNAAQSLHRAISALDRFIQLHPARRDIAYAYYLRALAQCSNPTIRSATGSRPSPP
jgi:hypothetical protein